MSLAKPSSARDDYLIMGLSAPYSAAALGLDGHPKAIAPLLSEAWTHKERGGNIRESAGLGQWIENLHSGGLEMSFVVGDDCMAMKQGGRRNQGIFARCRPVSALEVREQFLPPHQYRFGQGFRGWGKFVPCFRKPGTETGLMLRRSLFQSELQLGEGNDAQENLCLVLPHPSG